MRMLSAVAFLGLLAPGVLTADDVPADALTAVVGQRVRVSPAGRATAPDGRSAPAVVGVLESHDDHQLTISAKGMDKPAVVPLSAVRRIEVSRGRRSFAKQGAVAVGSAGVLFGLLVGYACLEGCMEGEGTARVLLVAPLVFGGMGAAAGGIVGAPFRTERWERMPLPAPNASSGRVRFSVHPVPRGAAAAMTLRF